MLSIKTSLWNYQLSFTNGHLKRDIMIYLFLFVSPEYVSVLKVAKISVFICLFFNESNYLLTLQKK